MNFSKEYKRKEVVPLPSDSEIRPIIGKNYDPKRALNVLKMFAGINDKDMYKAIINLIDAIFSTSGIDPRSREIIILRAAKILNVPYEWQANEKMAQNVGLSKEEIVALTKKEVSGIKKEYILLSKATDELSLKADFSDKILKNLKKYFGNSQTRKIIFLISWFNLLSRFLNGCRVPLEKTNKIGNGTSPLN